MEASQITVVLSTDFHSHITIPKDFSEKLFAILPEKITLKGPSGRLNFWEVELVKSDDASVLLGDGWREFVKSYSLQEKDILTFKYIAGSFFEVSVLDGQKLCDKRPSSCMKFIDNLSVQKINKRDDTRESSLGVFEETGDWNSRKRDEEQHNVAALTLEAQTDDGSLVMRVKNHLQRITQNCESHQSLLESVNQELVKLRQNSKKYMAQCASVRGKLSLEGAKKSAESNLHFEVPSIVQHKADDTLVKLAETQKMELEALHNKIMHLQNQLVAKQGLKLELETLRKFEADCEKLQVKEDELREKEEELEELNALTQALFVHEGNVKNELHEAHEALINGLDELSRGTIATKKLGELDYVSFFEACKRKYPREIAEVKAVELCSLWEANLQDPEWHPFKTVLSDGICKENIDMDDEKLQKVKEEWGEDVYIAVAKAMHELKEYNPGKRLPVKELWNFKSDRKATLREGAEFLLQKWKNKRRKN